MVAIHSYGKLATLAAQPHIVQAMVANTGSMLMEDVHVTLTVTGANTFTDTKTLPFLPMGSPVAVVFNAYPGILNPGTNLVTVSVADDDDWSNDALSITQVVSTNHLAYVDTTAALNTTGVSAGAMGGALAAKFTIPSTANYLSSIRATFAATTAGATHFRVEIYSPGPNGLPNALLYTSATQTRPAGTGTVSVTLPTVQVGGGFYVVLRELDNGLALATQPEEPVRPNKFYYQTANGPWTVSSSQTRWALELVLTTSPCPPPTNLVVSSTTPTTATLTFTAPTAGVGSYEIIYTDELSAGGALVRATGSPATLSSLVPNVAYCATINSWCSGGYTSPLAGPVCFTTPCVSTAAMPYFENFDAVYPSVLPCGLTVLNANNDGSTWKVVANNPNSVPQAMRYGYSVAGKRADDWFFTPGLPLTAGTTYQLQFKYRGFGMPYPEAMEARVGRAATPAGQSTVLFSNTQITNANYVTTTAGIADDQVSSFTPTVSGPYYFGFHVTSPASSYYLYVDDIELVPTGTGLSTGSHVVDGFRAEVSPVPFSERLTVTVNARQAGPLHLLLNDAVGRVVRETIAAIPVGASAVPLPGANTLPAGVYLLTVQQGGSTRVIRVARE
ncbi:choice-of-anchor J domain-containing protein [Hymenobacter negativus]|uniref:Choice-of-anchor J domain-containing protein n=1 Tax=Hymenobacter negativus TaxID=2795026 RepID=A0ABS0Q921_9BACT|nr:choice-of-anchor J domain-containing protein [Hymenobacter negativus]MBH8558716.1 choice-of-anchor J domain-containing protein [Hymenobacter negativus]